MKKIIALLLLAVLFLQAKELPKEKYLVEGMLPNGFSYTILHNEKPKDTVEFRLLVKAGSLDEEDEQRGLAHFVEHMAFNGIEHFKKNELISYLESIGLKFGGDLNANTGYSRTLYKLSVPIKGDNTDKALTILDDWAGGVLFNTQEYEKERGVILEEKRLRNNVSFRLYEKYEPLFYGESKYKDRTVIGLEKVIKEAPVQRVIDFYKKWYRPELMHLVVVGDVNATQMEQKIKKTFATLKNTNHSKSITRLIPEQDKTRFMVLYDKELSENSAEIYYLERVPGTHTRAELKRELITWMAQQLFNTAAKQEVLKADSKALELYTGTQALTPSKKAYLFSAGYQEKNREAAFAQLYRLMWRFEKYGFDEEALKTVKKIILKYNENAYRAMKTTKSSLLSGKLVQSIEKDAVFVDRTAEYNINKSLVGEITLQEVNARFKEILNIKDRVILFKSTEKETGLNKETVLKEIEKAKKEAKAPGSKEKKKLVLLDKVLTPGKIVEKRFDKETGIYFYRLENNVTVSFKPTDFQKNQVRLSAVSQGGLSSMPLDALNDAKKAAVWVMRSAPGDLKPFELRKVLADKSVKLDLSLSRFDEKINAGSTPKDLETLFQLLYMQVTAAKIDKGVDRQLHNIFMAQQAQADRDPAYKFDKAMNKFYYMNNPRILFDTNESIAALNSQKMLSIFNQKFADMNHFHFVIVGDTTTKQVERLIAKYLENLPTSDREEHFDSTPYPYRVGEEQFIERFNTTNIANIGLKYRSHLHYSIVMMSVMNVMNEILAVRLRNLVREEKSGTYGVGVNCKIIRELNATSSCNIRFASDPKRKEELIRSIQKSIETFKKEGPAAQELKNVKTEFSVQYKRALKNNTFWRQIMLKSAEFGTSVEAYLKYNEQIQNVTAKEIQEMANTMFKDDMLLSERLPQQEKK